MLGIILFLLSFHSPGFISQISHPFTTHLDSITEARVLNRNWLYHPGNDPEWASFDFDDTAWDTLSTSLNFDQMEKDIFEGKGWFRLHLEIDSSLFDQVFAFSIDQMGVSEIYLNGKKIETIGTFANDTASEKRHNQKMIPVLLRFATQKNQVLAIRYAHEKAGLFNRRYFHDEMGFTASIKPFQAAMAEVSYFLMANYSLLGLMMIFLILGFVHLLIFLFYRKKIANLYYSIFMFIFSFMVYVAKMELSITINPDTFIKARYFMSLGIPLFFISLLGFIYSLFYKKIPLFFWITSCLGLLISLGFFFKLSFISYILFVYAVVIPLETIRVLIRALIKKMDGAWIIASGVIFFILFLLSILLIAVLKGNIVLKGSDPFQFLILILIILAILSTPLSMSIYLARDIAKTNLNLEKQLEQVKLLSAKTLEQEREKKRILEGQKEMLEEQVNERTRELQEEKVKTEELLLNTLPLKVVNDLKENGKTEPESFENVTVFFSDIVGFTSLSAKLNPDLLIKELNLIFTAFDDIMVKNHCERIKTIGDAYLAVCGMPEKNDHHAEHMILAAIEIRHFLENRNSLSEVKWKIRIGIHSGKVIGGIVGVRKYIYDVFGDTINTTSRMESNSKPMEINVSETTYNLVKDKFQFNFRKPMEIKGKGLMKMYFLKHRE